jgi:hypothetical protein
MAVSNITLGTSTLTTSNGTLLVDGSPITGGSGITNATGPGITVASGILTLSTNGWQFGAALTPWTTNVDAGGYSLLNVGTLSAANINFGDGSLADMLASRLSTNFNGAWLVGSGGVTNGWTGGAITLDAANSNTNTFGGFLVIGPARYQANGGTASGVGSWANYNATASGEGSWANYSATASGQGSWANYDGTASGGASWANYGGTASGEGSWAMGYGAKATNDNTFVWSDDTAIGSTTNKQFTVYAANGIRLLGGPITGNGSGLTGVTYSTSSGIASNLHSGSATTGQVATANGSGGTFWATPAAGVATTPWTNSIMLRTGSFRNATTNDFLGGIITGSEALDTASGTSVALFNTVVNAATNIYNGSAWFVFPWPMGGDATTLQLGFRKTGTSATDFPLVLGYSNRFTGATASMVLTGQAAAADTTYWTNMSIVGSITTQAVQGAEWFLRWDPTFGATTNTTPGYMGIAIQGHILK